MFVLLPLIFMVGIGVEVSLETEFRTQYDIFVMNIICSLCNCLIILNFERGLAIPSDSGWVTCIVWEVSCKLSQNVF